MSAPLVGFRAWRMSPQAPDAPSLRPSLWAIFHGYMWAPGDNRARCLGGSPGTPGPRHEAPEEACRCGFYARTSAQGLLEEEYPAFPSQSQGGAAILVGGAVLLWGPILRGDKVIRAAAARPLCLSEPPAVPLREWVVGIARDYSLPLVEWGALADYCAEFGDLAEVE